MSEAPPYDADQVHRPANSRAVRPRQAATLILIRRDGVEPRLLMGRRSGGHDFMPNKWVFPGGRVDRGDFTAPSANELRPAVAHQLSQSVPRRLVRGLPRALAMAAIRETFEEAGLLLAKASPARPAAGAWRPFLATGAAPDLASLEFIARAVTPASRPKRFDARFFTADAKHLMSLERSEVSGELDEIDWFTFEAVLGLDLPTVTRVIVGELALRLREEGRPTLFLSTRSRYPAMA